MKYTHIICHYGELSLKGANRSMFEDTLIKNISSAISACVPDSTQPPKKIYGRLVIPLKKTDQETLNKLRNTISKIFGLSNFSFSIQARNDLEEIKKSALTLLNGQEFDTFAIISRRAQKLFKYTSQETNVEVGSHIVVNMKKKVDLTSPDVSCFIEITDKATFVYTKKHKGAGGMPVGTAGNALVFLSGGIDSPVATYYAMKRGLNVSALHFHAEPYTSKESQEKVRKLASILTPFQSHITLYMVNLATIQLEITKYSPEKLRIILYRRFMMRIGEKLAEQTKNKAIITGDSLGQVASQTLENITAVSKAIEMLILRPLIGFDKEDIVKKSQEINTYETSILPYEDCCAQFTPKSPETKAKLKQVLIAEKKLDVEKLVDGALSDMTTEIISTQKNTPKTANTDIPII